MSRAVSTLVMTLALIAAATVDAAGQSVAEVVERMYDAYERQAEGISDYTIVHNVMGIETVSHFEKELVEGRPVFRLRDSDAQGFGFGLGDESSGIGDVFLFGPELIEHGRYAGQEEIAGSAVHVLAVDDLAGLRMARPSTPGNMQFEPRTARIYIDDGMMVPRRMVFVGDAMTGSGPREITVRVDMESYLPIESLLVPYRTVVLIEGLAAAMDPEMRTQLQEMERQLADLPPDQREMAERMLGPQMQQLRQMMAGGADAMTVEITVVDVSVNAGRL